MRPDTVVQGGSESPRRMNRSGESFGKIFGNGSFEVLAWPAVLLALPLLSI